VIRPWYLAYPFLLIKYMVISTSSYILFDSVADFFLKFFVLYKLFLHFYFLLLLVRCSGLSNRGYR